MVADGAGESKRNTKLESHGANFKSKWSSSEVEAFQNSLLQDKMSISDEAFTLLIIENYLCQDENGALMFPAPVHKLKFTSRRSVGKDGSYSEGAISRHNELQTIAKDGREFLKIKYSNDSSLDGRPDVFVLPPLNAAALEAANSDGATESTPSMLNDILVFEDNNANSNQEGSPEDEDLDNEFVMEDDESPNDQEDISSFASAVAQDENVVMAL